MKSIKELLFKKEKEEQLLPLDQTNLETITNKELKQILARTRLNELQARKHALIIYMHRTRKTDFQPLETPSEKLKRTKKINQIIQLFNAEISKREKEQQKLTLKNKIQWNEDNVQKLLCNVRYTTEDGVLHLRSSFFKMTDMHWKTPTNTIIPITTKTGKKLKFDLLKIRPSFYQGGKFTPHFFTVEHSPSGGFRDGKAVPIIRDSNETYAQEQKIKMIPDTVIALMMV